MSNTLNSKILAVTRRTQKGFTVGEIFDRLANKMIDNGEAPPPYGSVRARVYELRTAGHLFTNDVRRDQTSGREAATFVRT
jgi:hypothetical protein